MKARIHRTHCIHRLMSIGAAAGWFSLALFLLAGCSSPRVSSDFPRVPDAWSATAQAGNVSTNWWTSFGDASLANAVQEGLVHNYDLKAAAARLESAAAQARIAGADYWPQVSLDFDASRRQQNFIGFPIPGGEERVLKTRATQFGVGLNTFWEVDLWGRVQAAKRAALADASAAEANFSGVQLSLAGQISKTWFAAGEANRQLELAEETVQTFRESMERVRDRFEHGVRSSLDLRLAQENLASAEALLHQRQEQRELVIRQFQLLLGRYPDGDLRTPDTLPDVPNEIPAGLPSELLTRRPDLVAAIKNLAAADARVWQAKVAFFPRISLTASGGTSTRELVDLVSSDFTVWSLAANLAQPLFEGGRLRAGLDQAKSRVREAWFEYAQAVLRAFTEVESVLATERFLKEREAKLAEAVSQAKGALRLAEERYTAGLEDIVTVLEAQRRTLNAESQWITARRLRLDARLDLHMALGGGFVVPELGPHEQLLSGTID